MADKLQLDGFSDPPEVLKRIKREKQHLDDLLDCSNLLNRVLGFDDVGQFEVQRTESFTRLIDDINIYQKRMGMDIKKPPPESI